MNECFNNDLYCLPKLPEQLGSAPRFIGEIYIVSARREERSRTGSLLIRRRGTSSVRLLQAEKSRVQPLKLSTLAWLTVNETYRTSLFNVSYRGHKTFLFIGRCKTQETVPKSLRIKMARRTIANIGNPEGTEAQMS
jgi:hypothetical protein